MARRRYLVAYDIRNDRRLRSIASCMEGYGTRIQYSVFVCDLSEREAILMRGDIEVRMKQPEDSVMIVDLGLPGEPSRFLFLGSHEKLPTSSAVIVLQASTPVLPRTPGSARMQVNGRSCNLTSQFVEENRLPQRNRSPDCLSLQVTRLKFREP